MRDPIGQSNSIRIGISGFGRLAQGYYAPALRRLKNANVVAIADPAAACRQAAARAFPRAKVFEDQQAMLDRVPLDGLLIATPPSHHLAAWRVAAAHEGLAVLIEKPFVLPAQLDEALELSATAGGRVKVNFNRRFWPRYVRIGELLRGGAIGQLVSARLTLQVDVSRWLAVTQHRLQAGEGGALCDLGSQMLDLASVIVGDRPTSVRATATSKRSPSDHVELALTFPSGGDVRCVVAYDDSTREAIEIIGSDGRIVIDDPNMAVHVIRNGRTDRRILRKAIDVGTLAGHAALRPTSMSRYTIEASLRAYVDATRTGNAFMPSVDDGLFNVRVLAAAVRSIASGRDEMIVAETAEVLA